MPWLWPAACLSGVPRGPAWCAAPRPVRSLSVLRSAFPTLWCLSPSRGLSPPDLLGGCPGHAEAGREPGSLCLPLAPTEAGALGSLRVVPVRGPAMGLSLAGPSGVGLGVRALRWLACVDPVTDASGFPYRPSFDGGLGWCTGAVSCGRRHLPLRVGGRHARVPCVCACARPSWPGRAGRPPGRVLVRLTFSFGLFVFLLCSASSGLGLPLSWSFVCPPLVAPLPPPPLFFLFFSRPPFVSCFLRFPAPGALGLGALFFFPPPPNLWFVFFCAPPLSVAFSGFRPRVPWAWRCVLFVLLASRFSALRALLPRWLLPGGCSPPPLSCLAVFVAASRCSVFFFVVRPRCLRLSLVSGPGCPGPGRCGLFVLLASRFSALCALSPRLCVPPRRWLLSGGCCPPPPLLSRCFRRRRSVLRFFFSLFRSAPPLSLPPLSLAFSGFRPRVPWALALCAVCFGGLPLLGSLCALVSFVFPAWPFAAPWWLLSPPPFVSRGFRRCLSVLGFVFVFRCAPPLSLAFAGFRPRVPWPLALCVVCFVGLPLLGSLCALASFVFAAWPWAAPWCLLPPPPLLCLAVFAAASRRSVFFVFFFVVRPRCLRLFLVSGPGCPGPWRCVLWLVLLCCFCFALLSCVAAFSAVFFFPLFLAFPWCSGLFRFLCSACAVRCRCACGVALCALPSCPCGASWCFVLLSVVFACLLLALAVLCCLLVGPGGSWCRVSVLCCGVSLGAVLPRVAACRAAWRCVVVRCVVSFCSAWCNRNYLAQ